MRKVKAVVLCAVLLLLNGALSEGAISREKLIAIEGLPFCAMIYYEDNNSRYDVRILMAPDHLNEDNLRLLFHVISLKYPQHQASRCFC